MSATGQVAPVAMRVGQLHLSYSVPCDQEQWIRCEKADRPAAGCCPTLLKRCEGWKGRPCGYAGLQLRMRRCKPEACVTGIIHRLGGTVSSWCIAVVRLCHSCHARR